MRGSGEVDTHENRPVNENTYEKRQQTHIVQYRVHYCVVLLIHYYYYHLLVHILEYTRKTAARGFAGRGRVMEKFRIKLIESCAHVMPINSGWQAMPADSKVMARRVIQRIGSPTPTGGTQFVYASFGFFFHLSINFLRSTDDK